VPLSASKTRTLSAPASSVGTVAVLA
jgi:hypothetical protein